MNHPRLRRGAAAFIMKAAVMATIVLCSQSAAAGPWDATIERRGSTSITRPILDLILRHERLNLSEDQRAIVELLWEDHLDRYRALRKELNPLWKKYETEVASVKAKVKKVRDEAGVNAGTSAKVHLLYPLLLEREKALAEKADEQVALDERFLDEVRGVLTSEQQAVWEPVRHRVNRARYLRRSPLFSEEGIDLVAIVEELELTPEDLVDPTLFQEILDRYAAELNRALMGRIEHQRHVARWSSRYNIAANRASAPVEIEDEEGNLVGVVKRDPDPPRPRRDRIREMWLLHEQARDANRTFRSILIGRLTNDAAIEFDRAWKEAKFASVGWRRESRPSTMYKRRVEALEMLTPEQSEVLEGLYTTHLARSIRLAGALVALRDEWASGKVKRAAEEAEASISAHVAESRRLRLLREQSADTRKELHAEEAKFIQRVWSMLTPEQRALAPKPED